MTAPTDFTPFEYDIFDQPEALRRLLKDDHTDALAGIASHHWDRIILTGMGSSHFAGLPTWRSLTAAQHPAWTVDAGQLLDLPELLTKNTLVIATSQSGRSGEVVELLDRMRSGPVCAGTLVGITADNSSPLATASDIFLPLHSGDEATVSTKSYLNTLAVHRRITAAFAGQSPDAIDAEITATADAVEKVISSTWARGLGDDILASENPRIAAVGKRDDAATALYAALITKESSKVAMEGFIGGQFRHGPYELAGPGLTVFIYGARRSAKDNSLTRLAKDLLATGASVVLVGDLHIDGATTVGAPGTTPLQELTTDAVIAQLAAVDIARANGVVPGAFAFGNKVTTAL